MKTVRQFHFTAWPDHGVPTYATSLLSFRKKIRSFDDPMAGPTVVHCRYVRLRLSPALVLFNKHKYVKLLWHTK